MEFCIVRYPRLRGLTSLLEHLHKLSYRRACNSRAFAIPSALISSCHPNFVQASSCAIAVPVVALTALLVRKTFRLRVMVYFLCNANVLELS